MGPDRVRAVIHRVSRYRNIGVDMDRHGDKGDAEGNNIGDIKVGRYYG